MPVSTIAVKVTGDSKRDDDVAIQIPGACAVDLGRLAQLRRDAAQAGQVERHDVAR